MCPPTYRGPRNLTEILLQVLMSPEMQRFEEDHMDAEDYAGSPNAPRRRRGVQCL